jgi:hypothetical protein
MSNYQNGKIYKIIGTDNEGNELIYIGSTIQELTERLRGHKKDMDCSSKIIFENCNTYKIQLIENYPCNSIVELKTQERYYYDLYDCINISKPILFEGEKKLYNQQRYIDNIEEYKKYRLEHKEYQHNYDKQYWEKNKIKLIIKSKLYNETNKEKIKLQRKEHYENNKDEILKQRALYREKNRDEINRKQREKLRLKKEQNLSMLSEQVI